MVPGGHSLYQRRGLSRAVVRQIYSLGRPHLGQRLSTWHPECNVCITWCSNFFPLEQLCFLKVILLMMRTHPSLAIARTLI